MKIGKKILFLFLMIYFAFSALYSKELIEMFVGRKLDCRINNMNDGCYEIDDQTMCVDSFNHDDIFCDIYTVNEIVSSALALLFFVLIILENRKDNKMRRKR